MTTSLSKKESKKRRQRTGVPPSPFNPVKLELGLIVVVGVSLLLAVSRWLEDMATQLAVLAAYGAAAALWLTLRTRRIVKRLRQGGEF